LNEPPTAPMPQVIRSAQEVPARDGKSPGVAIRVSVEKNFSTPAFRAECNHPCMWEGILGKEKVYFQRGYVDGKPNVAVVRLLYPDTVTVGTTMQWMIRSQDAEQLSVVNVRATNAK
jgi:hypothetical protein